MKDIIIILAALGFFAVTVGAAEAAASEDGPGTARGSEAKTAGTAGVPALETVAYVDLQRYMGTWYEIAAFPQKFQIQFRAYILGYFPTTHSQCIKK